MLPHTGPGSRTHQEIVRLGAELQELHEVVGGTVLADVALLMDWENWWAVEQPSHPSADLDYLAELRRWHGALMDLGFVVDVVHPGVDLSRYPVVLAPHLYLTTAEVAQHLRSYVEAGGHLAVGPFSGVVDETDRLHEGGLNAALAGLLGVRVEEFWPVAAGDGVAIDHGGRELRAADWTEHLAVDEAEVVGRFTSGDLVGQPALTRRALGSGVAWYLAATLDDPGLVALLGEVTGHHPNLRPCVDALHTTVSVVRRQSSRAVFTFVMNHGPDPATVTVGDETLELPGWDVRVLRHSVP
jgi:beta-galactosidase